MENNRGQSIFLSVVGLATLLVSIVGATFAYFTVQISGNNTASSINVKTADVAAVTFNDGPGITVTNAYPGYTKSKTFAIVSSSADSASQVAYNIKLVVSNGQLASAATNSQEFNYSLNGTATGSGTVATPKTNADVPTTTTTIGSGILKSNETHNYTFSVELKERGSAQDYLQGKQFVGILQVEIATTDGYRTWDETTSSWKKWSAS